MKNFMAIIFVACLATPVMHATSGCKAMPARQVAHEDQKDTTEFVYDKESGEAPEEMPAKMEKRLSMTERKVGSVPHEGSQKLQGEWWYIHYKPVF